MSHTAPMSTTSPGQSQGSGNGGPQPNQRTAEIPDLPSPTTIVGDYPKLKPADVHLVNAARQGPSPLKVLPAGWRSQGQFCYRNAVLIMLLSSDRFMGYVQNHHREIVETLRSLELEDSPGGSGDGFPPNYTDILLELNNLWHVFSSPASVELRAEAMSAFWKYAQKASKKSGVLWTFTGQQDAPEFLTFIISLFAKQTGHVSYLESDKKDFDSLTQLAAVTMRRCVDCVTEDKNEKVRSNTTDVNYFWNIFLEVPDDPPGSGSNSTDIPLLHNLFSRGFVKAEGGAYYCPHHYAEWEKKIEQAKMKESKEAYDKHVEERNDFSDWEWRRFQRLPEVLFMSLLRFRGSEGKNMQQVEIPEEIDLAQYVEPREQMESTRYKLSSVILHCGTEADKGHYINIAKIQRKWYEIDDTEYTERSFSCVNNHGWLEKKKFTPYLLCWEKVIPDSVINNVTIDLRIAGEHHTFSKNLPGDWDLDAFIETNEGPEGLLKAYLTTTSISPTSKITQGDLMEAKKVEKLRKEYVPDDNASGDDSGVTGSKRKRNAAAADDNDQLQDVSGEVRTPPSKTVKLSSPSQPSRPVRRAGSAPARANNIGPRMLLPLQPAAPAHDPTTAQGFAAEIRRLQTAAAQLNPPTQTQPVASTIAIAESPISSTDDIALAAWGSVGMSEAERTGQPVTPVPLVPASRTLKLTMKSRPPPPPPPAKPKQNPARKTIKLRFFRPPSTGNTPESAAIPPLKGTKSGVKKIPLKTRGSARIANAQAAAEAVRAQQSMATSTTTSQTSSKAQSKAKAKAKTPTKTTKQQSQPKTTRAASVAKARGKGKGKGKAVNDRSSTTSTAAPKVKSKLKTHAAAKAKKGKTAAANTSKKDTAPKPTAAVKEASKSAKPQPQPKTKAAITTRKKTSTSKTTASTSTDAAAPTSGRTTRQRSRDARK